jgi:hypothetical protein
VNGLLSRRHPLGPWILLTVGLCLFPAPRGGSSARAATQVQARVTPPVVPPNGEVELALEVRWEGFRSPRIDPSFELDNLEIVSGPRRSSSTTFLTGPAAQGLSLTWRLRPKQLGAAKVFNIRVRLDGTPYELPDCRLEARTDAPPPPPPPPRLADLAPRRIERRGANRPLRPGGLFLRAEVSPRQPYRGQQTLYTLYIYYQTDVRNIRPREMPRFQGFWVREVEAGDRSIPTLENGQEYFRSILLRRVLYPLRSGPLTITPTEAEMIAAAAGAGQASAGQGDRSPRGQRVVRESNAITLVVRDLPPPPPSSASPSDSPFTGLVGRLTAQATLEPATVTVGEAAVWTVTLQGTAHLRPLPDPLWTVPDGVRLLPVETTSGEEIEGATIQQLRRWRIPVVGERVGTLRLPAMAFPYFDPKTAQYRTARTPELALEVRPSSAVPPPLPEANTAPTDPGGARRWPRVVTVPLVAVGTALMGLILVWIGWRRKHRGPGVRARRHLLAALEASIDTAGDRSRKAASAFETAWRTYLESEGYLAAGVPRAQWGPRLARFGAHGSRRQRQERQAAMEALIEEFQALAEAPQLADTEALAQEALRQSRRVLRLLPPPSRR